jgi:ketosteroid isomerase-like protein
MTDLVAAEAGVRQLHARYADAVWRKDYASFADCFCEDAEWRIAGTVLRGRAPIAAALEQMMGAFERVLLRFGTPVLDLADGAVAARTWVTEARAFKAAPPSYTVGLYYERIRFDGGAWRFGWRLFQLHYVGPPDLSGPVFDQPDYGAAPAMPPADGPTWNSAELLARG